MKKIILSLSILLVGLTTNIANATVRTVSNNLNTPGQYTSINVALEAALNNDTIYVSPSPYTYGDITIQQHWKTLFVIGGGYNNEDGINTVFGTINFWTIQPGSVISGIKASNITNTGGVSNVTISRSHILGYINVGNGWIVENCIISLMNIGADGNNIAIRNNIITGAINGTTMGSNCHFYHNIIETTVNNMSFCTFTDNIFYLSQIAIWSNTINCVFNNNIICEPNSYGALAFLNTNGNIGHNNFNQDPGAPLFNTPTPPSAVQTYPALLNYNWTVAAGCQAALYSSDGTHCGIYGGYFPMQNLTGATPIPQMTYLNIPVNSVGLNQPLLNVQFKARKQN